MCRRTASRWRAAVPVRRRSGGQLARGLIVVVGDAIRVGTLRFVIGSNFRLLGKAHDFGHPGERPLPNFDLGNVGPREDALGAVQLAVESGVDMKLFARLLLEHVRAVMLLRNLPSKKENILGAFGTETQKQLEEYASGTSPLNSHLLLKLLEATELVARSPIPQAPLEIAIIDVTEG